MTALNSTATRSASGTGLGAAILRFFFPGPLLDVAGYRAQSASSQSCGEAKRGGNPEPVQTEPAVAAFPRGF